MPEPSDATPREVSEAYWAADSEAVMGFNRPDATYQNAGGLRRGHAEIRAAYEFGCGDSYVDHGFTSFEVDTWD